MSSKKIKLSAEIDAGEEITPYNIVNHFVNC